MVDGGLWGVVTAVATKPQPEREVAVFEVAEEALVEATHLDVCVAAIERRSRTRREHFPRAWLPIEHLLAVVAPPGEPADVVDVAGSVEPVPRFCVEESATKERELGLFACDFEQLL